MGGRHAPGRPSSWQAGAGKRCIVKDVHSIITALSGEQRLRVGKQWSNTNSFVKRFFRAMGAKCSSTVMNKSGMFLDKRVKNICNKAVKMLKNSPFHKGVRRYTPKSQFLTPQLEFIFPVRWSRPLGWGWHYIKADGRRGKNWLLQKKIIMVHAA